MNIAALKVQSQKTFDVTLQEATEEMNKQREANNKIFDETEETKLKQLCESKGLKIFNK